MALKIVHCADLHIGAPCQGLSTQNAAMRSGEIRDALSLIANFCKEKAADALLICGDLFDTPTPSKADCDFVRNVLASLSPIEVFIVCGNHDYMCSQSPFARQDYFSDNVHIFPCFEHSFTLSDKNAVFWGKSCSSNYIIPCFSEFTPQPDMINILCLHGDITTGSSYNIITKEALTSVSCEYVAFGHIHSGEIFKIGNTQCAYPGTPEGHKFNDDGITGFIYAEITDKETTVTPISMTKRKYHNLIFDIGGKTTDEIITSAKEMLNDTDFFRITFTGDFFDDRGFSADFIENELKPYAFHLEITDETTEGYIIEELEKEESIRGAFLRELRENCQSEEDFLLAAKAGLDALSGRVGGAL